MRVTLVSMMTFSHRSYRGFLDEVARRVDSLTVVTGDLATPHAPHAAPREADSPYELHLIAPRFARTPATVLFPDLGRLIADTKPDVVHLISEPWQLLALQGLRAARRSGAPISIQFAENGPRLIGAAGVVRRMVGSAFLRRFDRAVAMTSQSAAVSRRLAPGVAVAVVPPPSGVGDPSPAHSRRGWFGGSDESRFRIAFVGRLVAEKGLDDFIRVCNALEREVPIDVAVAGDGPLAPLVVEWAAAKRWRVHGRLDHMAVLGLLAEADVLVIPSRTVPGLAEQFGRVAVEAMSQGTPVAGYDCGALREVIGEGGYLVPEGDERALEAVVRDIALAPERARRDLGERARTRAQPFADAAIAQAHVSLWREMCGVP